jgi:TonB family protein
VKGQAVAKGAVLGIVEDTPFAGIDYMPGRTLDALLASSEQGPAPLPIEHALLITEKVLISLEAAKAFAKHTGAPHGFLVPAFISVSNDGDIRVYGGGLGPGLLPSLANARARAAFAPYIAPEVASSGKPSPAGDLYSTGAILFHTLTGAAPPTSGVLDRLPSAVLATNGNPVPDDVKALLAHALTPEPARRANDVVAFRKDLGKLLYGGPYAPSTFNLAFFMHQQFERAVEKERREIAEEEQIDPRPILAAEEEAARVESAPAAPREVTVPKFGMRSDTAVDRTLGGTPVNGRKSGLGGLPVPAVVGLVVVLAGAGLWFTMGRSKPAPPPPPTPVPVAPPTAVPTPAPPPTPMVAGKDDPDFQKAVAAKLAEEEKRIQGQIAKKQEVESKRRQDEQARIEVEARRAKEAEDALKSARDRADREEASRLAREASDARQREEAARAAAQAAAVPRTKTGELVEISQVDAPPRATKVVKPEPTILALRQHVSGTVMMRVLVNENGRAESIEVQRDTSPKVGLADACKTALQKWEWTPAMKDGQRVKTWIIVPIPFQKL